MGAEFGGESLGSCRSLGLAQVQFQALRSFVLYVAAAQGAQGGVGFCVCVCVCVQPDSKLRVLVRQ